MAGNQITADALGDNSTPRRVIVFAQDLLPISETFIREQVRTLKTWQPILVGERLTPDGLPLASLNHCLLCPVNESKLRRWTYVFCRILGIPHLPSVRRLRRLHASLIHVHFGTSAVEIWPLARMLSLPMLVTLHGFDINIHREWWESGNGGWQRKNYPRMLLKLARKSNVSFIAVSEAIRKRAIEYGIPVEKITVHYTGVDTEKFSPAKSPDINAQKRILFVGRLVEKKGVRYLLQAYAKLSNDVRTKRLVIVGDGPQRATLEKLAQDLGIDAEFTGARSGNQILEQLHAAYVLCLPSITADNGDAEGMGMVLLEAQACGIPVISSAKGGANEGLLDKKTGFSFGEKDVDTLAECLHTILSDDDLHSRFSTEAVAFARNNFSLHRCSSKLELIYDSRLKPLTNERQENPVSHRQSLLQLIKSRIFRPRFSSSAYWEARYKDGGNSGGGSYGHLAEYKAGILNQFVADNAISSVIEFGSGDGNQLRLSTYPSYIGYDVSTSAIARCKNLFSEDRTKEFRMVDEYHGETADMAISLDVIFHLIEDDVYENYMHRLFTAALRHVVIYSSNKDETPADKATHVKHRKFTDWVKKNFPEWKLANVITNKYPYDGDHITTTFADFYFFERT